MDGDTGHGGIMAVRRMVRECIRRGIAGVRIDDQPIEGKRKTQNAGVEVVPLDQAIARYRAAVDMKNELDPDFVVMAQCYARDAANGGLDDALRRLKAYREAAGVDWVQFESPHSVEEIKQARAAVDGPFSFMKGKLGRYLGLDEHLALGVTIAWYPAFTHHVTWAALSDFMTAFGERRHRRLGGFRRKPPGPPLPDRPKCPKMARGRPNSASWKNAICPTRHARKRERIMARNGYRIFDSDTHVGPDAAILYKYLSAGREGAARRLGAIPSRPGATGMSPTPRASAVIAGSSATRRRKSAGRLYGGVYRRRARRASPRRMVDADPSARIADLDYEGVDVNLTLPSGWFGTWTAGDDVALEMAMYRAYHRWMADYCGAYPRRLGGVILAGSRDVAGSLAEMRRCGRCGLGLGRHGLCAPWGAARPPRPRAVLCRGCRA